MSPLRVGDVLEIKFPAFTPRISLRSERELIVEIVAGDNIGFSDTVEYGAVAVRDGLVILSWQEHIEAHSCTCSISLLVRHTLRSRPRRADSCD